MFQTVPPSIIRSFSLYTQQWYMSYRFCWQLASRIRLELQFHPDPVRKLSAKSVWRIRLLRVQRKTPDDGQSNCLKHVEFFISILNQPDAQNLFHNKFYFMPLHVSSTCAHHCITQPLVSSHLQVWWYRRLCNAILTSWWWAHVLETCRGMK